MLAVLALSPILCTARTCPLVLLTGKISHRYFRLVSLFISLCTPSSISQDTSSLSTGILQSFILIAKKFAVSENAIRRKEVMISKKPTLNDVTIVGTTPRLFNELRNMIYLI